MQPYILVMEDEDALATLLQYNLEKEGYDVVIASDGEEGLVQVDERQPVASDLRKTLSAMKLATDLERTGDLAKNIAKRALSLAEAEPMQPLTRSIERMGKLVSMRLRDVLDAYTASEIDRAMAVWASDDEVDEHYNALFRELLTYMMGDPRTISACTPLLFMAKNLERIGDHATNIAEVIHYEITGDEITGERPRWTPSPGDWDADTSHLPSPPTPI